MSFETLSGNTEGFHQPIVFFSENGLSCFEVRNSQYANLQVTLGNICLNFYIIKISSLTIRTYKRLYITTRNGILDMYRDTET